MIEMEKLLPTILLDCPFVTCFSDVVEHSYLISSRPPILNFSSNPDMKGGNILHMYCG
jgi:hypothetical protein